MKRAFVLILACMVITFFTLPAIADSLELVSMSNIGGLGDNTSVLPAVSADGRYVAFISMAANFVIPDSNNYWDVYVRDRWTGNVTRASVDSNGVEANQPSVNYALFDFEWPAISADGRYVAFNSYSSNLVPGDTNGAPDVFVHDMVTGETTRVSIDPDGQQFDCWSAYFTISGNGRYVAFSTLDDSNSGLYLYDRETGTTRQLPLSQLNPFLPNGIRNLSLSADGRYLTFYIWDNYVTPGQVPSSVDIYVYDTVNSTVQLVANGGYASISANGRYIVFSSGAAGLDPSESQPNELGLYVLDRDSGATEHIIPYLNSGTEVVKGGTTAHISSNGRFIAYEGNLYTLDGKTDTYIGHGTFLYDRQTRYTKVVAMNAFEPAFSADGSTITFMDTDSLLVDYDTNIYPDIYAYVSGADSPCDELDGLVEVIVDMKTTDKGKFLSTARQALDACESGNIGSSSKKLDILIHQLEGNTAKNLNSIENDIAISMGQSFINSIQ